ncbi:MAG: outer membrane protein OmpA-like peptidoglycan-associated protein [Parasphingorhabdus sp.]
MFSNLSASEEINLLGLSSGALMLSHSGEYKETWASMLMLDGSTKRGWSSPANLPFPHSFVIELKDRVRLKQFVVDNSDSEEARYKGISIKDFRLSGRNNLQDEFTTLGQFVATAGARSEIYLTNKPDIRWLKVEVLSNHGHADFSELMEIEAYGEVVAKIAHKHQLSGVYETNYNLMLFATDQQQVQGCYDWDSGRLTGTSDGRVVQFEWRENNSQVGTAIMVLAHDGNYINGLWYEKGKYRGLWTGQRATDGRAPKCTVASGNAIQRGLEETGRVITYGIHFDHDSDQLRADSEPALNLVLDALTNNVGLRIVIEGHTDADGDDDYNLDLSNRRATSVASWLTRHGIEGRRLKSTGLGESMPVSDNETVHGKALNRRVELRTQK